MSGGGGVVIDFRHFLIDRRPQRRQHTVMAGVELLDKRVPEKLGVVLAVSIVELVGAAAGEVEPYFGMLCANVCIQVVEHGRIGVFRPRLHRIVAREPEYVQIVRNGQLEVADHILIALGIFHGCGVRHGNADAGGGGAGNHISGKRFLVVRGNGGHHVLDAVLSVQCQLKRCGRIDSRPEGQRFENPDVMVVPGQPPRLVARVRQDHHVLGLGRPHHPHLLRRIGRIDNHLLSRLRMAGRIGDHAPVHQHSEPVVGELEEIDLLDRELKADENGWLVLVQGLDDEFRSGPLERSSLGPDYHVP